MARANDGKKTIYKVLFGKFNPFIYIYLKKIVNRSGPNDRSRRESPRRLACAKHVAQRDQTQDTERHEHARLVEHAHTHDRSALDLRQVRPLRRHDHHVCRHVFGRSVFNLEYY